MGFTRRSYEACQGTRIKRIADGNGRTSMMRKSNQSGQELGSRDQRQVAGARPPQMWNDQVRIGSCEHYRKCLRLWRQPTSEPRAFGVIGPTVLAATRVPAGTVTSERKRHSGLDKRPDG